MRAAPLDWGIILLFLGIIIGIACYSKRFMRSTADFLAANRLAGRYLLTVSSGFSGAITLVAVWEMTYSTGLPPQWWAKMSAPVSLIVSLTGFAVYRFRQTRALTLAQFLEERYSRSFRLFAGTLCWFSGVLNYGIFPAITARIIIHFLGLPPEFTIGGVTLPTFPAVMTGYLSVAVFIACSGGMISIMVTDFLQGAALMLIFVVLTLYLLGKFNWNDIVAGLEAAPAAGTSLINPFAGSATGEFSIWFFLIGIFGNVYGIKSWQGNSGYGSAARTPHEAVMANVIGQWRSLASNMCLLIVPLIAYSVFHLAKYSELAGPIRESIEAIADPQVRFQMTVPVFLSHVLPTGLFGLFAALVICCAISNDDTYLHSWGTILIQDVITPLRGRPFEPETHLLLLRCGIVGVALFGFTFSMLFPLRDFILMYFAVTGAIYLGGAGAVILGGLYWRYGTTAGAWTAMSIGTLAGLGGIVLQQCWPAFMDGEKFPVNSQWIYFLTMLSAIAGYVLVSLLGRRKAFDMDRLLHRGAYAPAGERTDAGRPDTGRRFTLARLIGIGRDFTKFEKFIFYATFCWTMLWYLIFVAGCVLSLFLRIPDSLWKSYWYCYIMFSIVLGAVCTVWIFCGGVKNAFELFRDLRSARVDDEDDGFVRK
ncbi:MAG: sodium:solute symporter [Lentisphaeria bacterium]|nr:sodium:solute symporter [Lentisphaeria bacterium]